MEINYNLPEITYDSKNINAYITQKTIDFIRHLNSRIDIHNIIVEIENIYERNPNFLGFTTKLTQEEDMVSLDVDLKFIKGNNESPIQEIKSKLEELIYNHCYSTEKNEYENNIKSYNLESFDKLKNRESRFNIYKNIIEHNFNSESAILLISILEKKYNINKKEDNQLSLFFEEDLKNQKDLFINNEKVPLFEEYFTNENLFTKINNHFEKYKAQYRILEIKRAFDIKNADSIYFSRVTSKPIVYIRTDQHYIFKNDHKILSTFNDDKVNTYKKQGKTDYIVNLDEINFYVGSNSIIIHNNYEKYNFSNIQTMISNQLEINEIEILFKQFDAEKEKKYIQNQMIYVENTNKKINRI